MFSPASPISPLSVSSVISVFNPTFFFGPGRRYGCEIFGIPPPPLSLLVSGANAGA
jgi:hypothetical protein